MADGSGTSRFVFCPFCWYANVPGVIRCMQCQLPMELTPCPACEAVNAPSDVRCHQCGVLLATERAPMVPPCDPAEESERSTPVANLRVDRVFRPRKAAEFVGTLLGFGLAIGLAVLLVLDRWPDAKRAAPDATSASGAYLAVLMEPVALRASIEPLLEAPVLDEQPPRRLALAEPYVAKRAVPNLRHPARSAVRHHVVAGARATPALPRASPEFMSRPDPPVLNIAAAPVREPSRPAATDRMSSPIFACTPAAIRRELCRPEGALTGQ